MSMLTLTAVFFFAGINYSVADSEEDKIGLDDMVELPEDPSEDPSEHQAEDRGVESRVSLPESRPDPTGFTVSTLGGGAGLFNVHTADVGRFLDLRFGIHFGYFRHNHFIVDNWAGCGTMCPNETNTRTQGAVTVGFTPYKYLEVFAALYSSANRNDRNHQPLGPGERNPNETPLQMALGDFLLGLKGAFPVTSNGMLSLGALAGVKFLSSQGQLKPDFGATNLMFAGLMSADFRKVHRFLPLRAHLNVGYIHDRSMELVDNDIYKDPAASSEYHHYYLVQQFALGMNTSRARIALGLDVPIPYLASVLEDAKYLRWFPEVIFELGMDVAVGSPDEDIQQWAEFGGGQDYNIEGRLASKLSMGLRFKPVAGLHVDVGVDVAMTHFGFAMGPAQPPWNLFFQAGYTVDTRGAREVVRVKEVEKRVIEYMTKEPEPTEGRIRGTVTDSKTKAPVAAAILTFVGQAVSDIATAEDGSYMSFDFKEGTVRLEVRKEGYEPWTGEVEVKAGEVAVMDIELVQEEPKVGTIIGSVVSSLKNRPVAATIKVEGPEKKTVEAASDGTFQMDVKPGDYRFEAVGDEHFNAQGNVRVAAGQKELLEVTMTHKPRKLLVVVTKKAIQIRRRVHFATGKAEIRPDSTQLLDQVAGVIMENPEIKKLRVEGHTDDRGAASFNLKLSQARAEAVRDYLVEKGVDPERIEAVGYGQTRPLVPNFSARNRRRNRRVEFRILERDGD